MTELRIYPYSYINFRLGAAHLLAIDGMMASLKKDATSSSFFLKLSEDKITACMAFAAIYGFLREFREKSLMDFKFDSPFDFATDQDSVKLLISRVNPKWENTGPRITFRFHERSFAKCTAQTMVLAVFNMPFIQFVGWLPKDALKPYKSGLYYKPHVNCLSLKPMYELPFEARRVSGEFV